ncbi:MAG: MBL fold metallo-hydrolase [Ramlibacter sp.]|jgi:flavorubredoxin
MDTPTFTPSLEVAPATWQFGAWVPLPTLGWLPVNSYLVQGTQPILVDTGMAHFRDDLVRALSERMDPRDLRWIWITHMDADHVGNLAALLALCPRAQVVTNALGVAKMDLLGLPAQRAVVLQPGEALDAGDRLLRAVSVPVFDAPETMGFLDSRTRALFSSDCFGALQPRTTRWAREIERDDLARGMATWANIDAPWLQYVDRARWERQLNALAGLDPSVLLSSHLQPAPDMLPQLLDVLAEAPAGEPALAEAA